MNATKAKHTWRFATSPSSGYAPFCLMHGDCFIAEVKPCPTIGSGYTDEQILSLIQAAPDLLAACKGLLSGHAGAGSLSYEQRVTAAKAAIRKAEGQ